ncbi:MAG: HEAT repeat domain-containing protein, partial [Deltaproteobacteria bacterium]|nr:HEAT repeat domain-containing protein [Deltaproteobacteria bacterium]
MMSKARGAAWITLGLVFLGSSLTLGGCNDPKDPKTWIKKLKDPRESENAVFQLKKLGKAEAVLPLCKLFDDTSDSSVLKAIISFKDKRAIPTLIKALDFSVKNYHNASVAASALARLKAVEAVPALIQVLKTPLSMKSRANKAKVAAIEALRKLGDKKAVPALISVAEGKPEKQDFFLNKRAMVALGDLGDAEAVPVLVRGLFMASTIQGTSYPMARVALVKIGSPSVAPLVAAMKKENKLLNLMAKDLEFRPGVILNKTAIVLGDLRAKAAIPTLLELFKKANLKETKIAGVIEALGKIGDPRAVVPLLKAVKDKKANYKIRMQICNALTVLGDKRAVSAMLEIAEKGFIDGGYYNLREAGAMAWGRIVGSEVGEQMKVMDAMLADKELNKYKQNWKTFKEAKDRALIAVKCKDDAKCYGKALDNKKLTLAQREKAAVMVGILKNGRDAIPDLVTALPEREPILRLF